MQRKYCTRARKTNQFRKPYDDIQHKEGKQNKQEAKNAMKVKRRTIERIKKMEGLKTKRSIVCRCRYSYA